MGRLMSLIRQGRHRNKEDEKRDLGQEMKQQYAKKKRG